MDLKQYYRKLREIEAKIEDEFPLIVSLDTPEGGKSGVICEVTRLGAAKMISEGRAVLATEEQKELHRKRQAEIKAAAEKEEMTRRIQVAILSDADMQPSPGKKK